MSYIGTHFIANSVFNFTFDHCIIIDSFGCMNWDACKSIAARASNKASVVSVVHSMRIWKNKWTGASLQSFWVSLLIPSASKPQRFKSCKSILVAGLENQWPLELDFMYFMSLTWFHLQCLCRQNVTRSLVEAGIGAIRSKPSCTQSLHSSTPANL